MARCDPTSSHRTTLRPTSAGGLLPGPAVPVQPEGWHEDRRRRHGLGGAPAAAPDAGWLSATAVRSLRRHAAARARAAAAGACGRRAAGDRDPALPLREVPRGLAGAAGLRRTTSVAAVGGRRRGAEGSAAAGSGAGASADPAALAGESAAWRPGGATCAFGYAAAGHRRGGAASAGHWHARGRAGRIPGARKCRRARRTGGAAASSRAGAAHDVTVTSIRPLGREKRRVSPHREWPPGSCIRAA